MKHELRTHNIVLIDPARWQARLEILDAADPSARAADGRERAGNWWEEEDVWGEPLPKPETSDGVCVIPIKGVITCGLPKIYRAFGYVDCEQIGQWVDEAAAKPDVGCIILDIASPGGMVGGVMELAEKVSRAAACKRVYVFTKDLCCSAAYWIAAGADAIFATPSAEVGSIGVYMVLYDVKKAFEMFGYKVEIIKAGRLKAIGVPGTSLTEEQKAHLQEGVDEIYEDFTGHVTTHRPGVESDTMQGQSFSAKTALAAGLIDDVAGDIREVKEFGKR